jgi:AcrR family transcriptional regulator
VPFRWYSYLKIGYLTAAMDRAGDANDDGGSLRAVRFWPGPGVRRTLLEAVLDCVGERGYGDVTLGEVVARAGTTNRAFHKQFATLADCFAEAYELAAEDLAEHLLTEGRRPESWRAGFRAALVAFLDFVKERPDLARVLLVEHRAAGGRVAAKHADVIARLAQALGRGTGETSASDRLPSFTPQLLLGVTEFSAVELIIGDRTEHADELLPSISYLAVLLYYGREAAEKELSR